MSDSGEVSDGGLPEGWAATNLGEVVSEVQPGFACGTNNRGGDGVAHLRPMNVSTEGKIDLSDVKYVPAEAADNDRKWLQRGDVLFNNTNSTELVGKTAVYDDDEPRAFSNHMTRVRVRETALNPRYCAAFLHHCWREGYFQGICNQHVSQSSVSRTRLLDTPLGLPPLAEQRRIVSMVENLLERVNKARQRLDRVSEILKRFRQSILSAACSGRLTAEWREAKPYSESADSRFERLLHCRQKNWTGSRQYPEPQPPNGGDLPELPDEWRYASVSELIRGPLANGRSVVDQAGGFPVLRLTALKHGTIDLSESKEGKWTAEEAAKYVVEKDDFLVSRGNGSLRLVGRGGLVETEPPPVAYPDTLIRVRLSNEMLVRFFRLAWDSDIVRSQIETAAHTTAGIHKVSQQDLGGVAVPFPSNAEQEEIVGRVESLLAVVNRIEQRYTAAKRQVEFVAQSVLSRAFSGELVETEADLARREGRDYEPASVLLQRLAAGSSAATPSIQLERGRAVLDILLLLEALNQPVSISALEPALVLMRNDAACQALLSRPATRRRRRSLSNEPQFVRGLDVIYTGLVANGAIRRVGQSGFELANSQLLAQASAADRAKAAEVIRAIQTLSDLRSLPQAVASITHEQYEITV